MTKAYYNEIDPHAADVLRNLVAAGDLPAGDVDGRSIVDVQPEDLRGYDQCHFFAGIGGWPAAQRRVGWRDDRPAWSASLPCQPFSPASRNKRGFGDERHLWPEFERLVAACRPPVIVGEQSANAAEWLGAVRNRLDSMEYAMGAVPIEAACAGAEHVRARYYFVADADDEQRRIQQRVDGRRPERARDESDWGGAGDGLEWFVDSKGKSRRAPSGIRRMVDGISGKVDRRDADGATSFYSRIKAVKGFGNAIDLRPASKFIASCMDILVPLFIAALTALIAVAAVYNGHGGIGGWG